jgi:vitamin B12 transporter
VLIQNFNYQIWRLNFDVIRLNDITVDADYQQQELRSPKYLISNHDEPVSIRSSTFFKQLPGVTIKRYGGPAGISQISSDGGSASQTKILLNGFDLTSAQNGSTDISQLPPQLFNTISFDLSQRQKQSGMSDGVIGIQTDFDKRYISMTAGSFGERQISGAWNLNTENKKLFFAGGHSEYEGNYPSIWRDIETSRRNNNFRQDYVFSQGQLLIPNLAYLRIIGLESQQNRGVAGQSWNPDTVSRRSDKLSLLGFQSAMMFKKGSLFGQLMRRSSEEYFDQKLGMLIRHYQHNSETNLIHLRGSIEYNAIKFIASREDRFESLSSDAVENNVHRRITQMTANLIVSLALGFRGTANIHSHQENLKSQLTHYGYSISWESKLPYLPEIFLSQESYYRIPTLNDLYWQPGGNPALLAETTQSHLASLNWIFPSTHFRILAYGKISQNLIQWMPQNAYWRPVNILEAKRSGIKASGHFQIHSNLEFNMHYGWHHSESLSGDFHNGKALRFAPNQTGMGNFRASWHRLNATFQADYIASRISMYGYPEDIILPEATFYSLGIGTTLQPISIHLKIDNISDVYYETILGYPEPPRSFSINILYNFRNPEE